MSFDDYAERNRKAWNEAAGVHRRHRDLRSSVRDPAFNALDTDTRALFAGIELSDKRVAQPCCNNGRELISLCRMGASSGVGFDIADVCVAEACELARLAQAPCEFVCCDVRAIPEVYDDAFDVVLFTVGALCWVCELDRLFAVAARLLRDEGLLVVHELHPFTDVIATPDDPGYDPDDALKVVFSYFKIDPWVSSAGLDYLGGTTYDAPPSYAFPHTLSETISAIIDAGFVLQHFAESARDIANSFAHLEQFGKLPLSYSLMARKAA